MNQHISRPSPPHGQAKLSSAKKAKWRKASARRWASAEAEADAIINQISLESESSDEERKCTNRRLQMFSINSETGQGLQNDKTIDSGISDCRFPLGFDQESAQSEKTESVATVTERPQRSVSDHKEKTSVKVCSTSLRY
jgi:hypothetical protein